MPLSTSIYNTFFRSNGMMLATVFGAAFGFQIGFDVLSDRVWDSVNRGRQWKDIKHKYLNKEDDEE